MTSAKLQSILNLFFVFALVFGSCAQKKIYVVRHAEKLISASDDPGLSDSGIQRSNILRDSLGGKNITCIYTSQYIRTKQTAEPLSHALNLNVEAIPAEQPEALVSELKSLQRNESALVVAHSNTIPPLIKKLSGIEVDKISDHDYDDIYIITIQKPFLRREKYGLEIINFGTVTQ